MKRSACHGGGSCIEDFSLTACDLQSACLDKLREETAEYPEFQDFDDPSADGASTRNISSVGTPQPTPKSGFKLRLNGGGRGNGRGSRGGTESAMQSDDDE